MVRERLTALFNEVASIVPIRKLPVEVTYREAVEVTKRVLRSLREYLSEIHVMFSGGKDSLVVLHLASSIFDKVKCVYIVVNGNTHEKNEEYVTSIAHDLGVTLVPLRRSNMEFYSQVVKWGWPGPRRKWCMTEFKRKPIEKYFRNESTPIALVGTKRSDSGRRKLYVEKDGILYISKWSTIVLRPIAHWSNEFVKRYIKEKRLPICGLYDELGESGNCVYCPFIVNKAYYRKLLEHYPCWIKKILLAEAQVKKGKPFILGRRKVGLAEIIGIEYSELLRLLDSRCGTQQQVLELD